MKLRLTFPKSHSIDEIRPLFDRFKSEEHEVYSRWFSRFKDLEGRASWDDSQELKEISDVAMEFIRQTKQ